MLTIYQISPTSHKNSKGVLQHLWYVSARAEGEDTKLHERLGWRPLGYREYASIETLLAALERSGVDFADPDVEVLVNPMFIHRLVSDSTPAAL